MAWILAVAASLVLASSADDFTLTVLHTNDVHSRYKETDLYGGACSADSADRRECVGGVARRFAKIEEIRRANGNSTILLDAGDQFQGTLWFAVHGANITSHFMNVLRYDAMAIGNHDLDLGISGLAYLVDRVAGTFPVLSCNLNASSEPRLSLVKPYTILTKSGRLIGIIGYTVADMPSMTSPRNFGSLSFSDEVKSVRMTAAELRSKGVNIIIALGHAGYDVDQRVAAEVEDIDIVVGGHSHTFLYSGPQPSNDVPTGPYPTVVTKSSGRKALVVQAFYVGKYLGRLNVTFDDSGELKSWSGNPILLDANVMQDQSLLDDVGRWGEAVKVKGNQVVGNSRAILSSARLECGMKECALGNAITDAFVEASDDGASRRSSLAVFNVVSLGTSIKEGMILYQDVLATIPYQNTVDLVTLRGEDIIAMFEYSVSGYGNQTGTFLQVSGFRVVYHTYEKPMSRVASVSIRCLACNPPAFEPLDVHKNYTILIPSYMAVGGGGYTIINEKKLKHEVGLLDADLFISYLKVKSPLRDSIDGRVQVILAPMTSAATHDDSARWGLLLTTALLLLLQQLFEQLHF